MEKDYDLSVRYFLLLGAFLGSSSVVWLELFVGLRFFDTKEFARNLLAKQKETSPVFSTPCQNISQVADSSQ